MARHAALFDIDGTLVNSLPLYQATINYMLGAEGLGPIDAPTTMSLFQDNIEYMIRLAFKICGKPLADEAYPAALERYMAFYEDGANCRRYVEPYPGVPETLEALRQTNIKLGIVTNRPYSASVKILEEMGLLSYFPDILSIDRVTKHKPDPAHLIEALEQMNLNRDEAVMVGDHDMDVIVSKRAGVPAILLTYGYAPSDPATLDADVLIGDFRDLPEALRSLP
ncbi:MAG: HAD-IA family hydrolase [Alphaproteobacteria bacterium]|nr:HAD-IA family hydrolase [Alphaproteobacteria bacterium]